MRILFMGTADFGVTALKRLINEKFTIAGIVTAPPRPKGRGLKIEGSRLAEFADNTDVAAVFAPKDLRKFDFIHEL